MSFRSFRTFLKKQGQLTLTLLLFFILLSSLLMTSDVLRNSVRFQHLYSLLLLINSTGLVILVILIGLNLQHLIVQLRRRRPGARLTVRLVSVFVLLAAAPVLIVYYFSLEFLHQRIDSWLDARVEKAMSGALELSKASLDAQLRNALQQTEQIAEQLGSVGDSLASLRLQDLRAFSGAVEVALLAGNGHIIAFDSAETSQLLPNRPDDRVLMQLKQQHTYIGLEQIPERGLHVRTIVECCSGGTGVESNRWLYALYPVAERIDRLAAAVESASGEYNQMLYLRQPLKTSYTLVLSLVLLVSVFGAIWVAFFSARRMVAPIRDLVEGTRAVAAGNYDKQLPESQMDELGGLVQSFNEMTRKLSLARNDARRSQELADAQRAYLQVLMERLSSGVLSLDQDFRLRTSNAVAEAILNLPLTTLSGEDFMLLCAAHPHLQPLCQALEPHLRNPEDQDWREQLTLFGASGRKILMCRGTRLPALNLGGETPQTGHVIVFDDITTLVQAQRDSAWGEVARRLAHEIKNPLTPIRLSAERLRHKYLPTFPDKEAEVLDRMTYTIIQQVEAMKEMVNAFSEYARPPEIKLISIDLNQLVSEVAELYRAQADVRIELDPALPIVEVDPGKLRQVLHNLLKNALEAQPDAPSIHVTSHYHCEETMCYVEVRVVDRGPGIPEKLMENIFEPYVTNKTKGTGLGLAIVKKIVEEHGGLVWLENAAEGACAVIRLPAPLQETPPQAAVETEQL